MPRWCLSRSSSGGFTIPGSWRKRGEQSADICSKHDTGYPHTELIKLRTKPDGDSRNHEFSLEEPFEFNLSTRSRRSVLLSEAVRLGGGGQGRQAR